MKNTNFQFPAQTKMGAFFTRRNHPLSNEKVTHIQGVPPISTHFRFQFLTFLMVVSKKANYAILTHLV